MPQIEFLVKSIEIRDIFATLDFDVSLYDKQMCRILFKFVGIFVRIVIESVLFVYLWIQIGQRRKFIKWNFNGAFHKRRMSICIEFIISLWTLNHNPQ